ncbi:MAG: YbaK/EbsC family protein [Lachnospiraceae bacterium]|nr:YbaK/EbsC family protein [Lachnospiraceae bacterium]
MGYDKAREHLAKCGLEDRIKLFDVSTATCELAAQALGTIPAQIAKTMSFWVGEEPILILATGDVKIDNHKYKEKFHTKAKMISFDEVEAAIGHAVGGVCPFGVNDNVKVYLDESLKKFEIVYPAAGTDNSAVKLTIPELEQSSGYLEWIDVTKLPE